MGEGEGNDAVSAVAAVRVVRAGPGSGGGKEAFEAFSMVPDGEAGQVGGGVAPRVCAFAGWPWRSRIPHLGAFMFGAKWVSPSGCTGTGADEHRTEVVESGLGA